MHFESLLTFKQLVMLKIQYFRLLNIRLVSHGLFAKDTEIVTKRFFSPIIENLKCVFASFLLNSRSSLTKQIEVKRIQFKPVFGKKVLFLNDSIYRTTKNTFKFKTLKFYISSVRLLFKNRVVYSESDRYHLIDVSKPSSLLISLGNNANVEYDTILFNLGLNNLNSIIAAMGQNIHLTNSIYCGYVNFNLEGSSSGQGFLFHLCGYQTPFQTWQEIKLEAHNNEIIDVFFDLKQFVESIDITQLNRVLPPSQKAKEMSEKLAQCFY